MLRFPMKISGKTTGFGLLAAIYACSVALVFRTVAHNTPPGRVTIRVCQWQLETGVREAFNAMIKRYEQLNPRVHVEQIAVPGGPLYTSWVLTQMVGGTGPDLVQYTWNGPDIPRIFRPITAEVSKPNPYNKGTPLEGVPWRDTFIDGMTSPDSYIDALHEYYSVSLDTHLGRIVYNKPLLRKITGSDTPPATYRELLADCDRIRAYAAEHHLNLVPIANSHDTNEFQSWLIAQAMTIKTGLAINPNYRLMLMFDDVGVAYLRGDWSFDTPEVEASVRELREYGQMCNPGFWERERDTADTDFVCERSVMIVAPSWEATNLLGLCTFPIAAFPFPFPTADDPVYGKFATGPYCEGQVTTGLPIYVNRTTPHYAEAMDFLHFITSVEGSTIFTRVSNWPPATVGVEPSPFAAQFKLQSGGYCSGMNWLAPMGNLNSFGYVLTHMADLWASNGSVDAFRASMRTGYADELRADLRQEVVNGIDNMRRVDTEGVAGVMLARPGARPPIVPLVSITVSQTLYQSALLASMKGTTPEPPPIKGPPDLPPAVAAAPVPAAAPAPLGPDLEAAWRQVQGLRPDKALPLFEAMAGSPEPRVARPARLGRAVCLIDLQPVSPSQIAQARSVLATLDDGSPDDTALAARFLLGRIAQAHQDVPDPAEAARLYRSLISEAPGSIWAQTALPQLALLELYALDGSETPARRIARASSLLDRARSPEAASDLQVALAYAAIFYRTPPIVALPHLKEAVRLGRVAWPTRRDALLQIAEISRITGDTAQAVRYYHTFLDENPIDQRVYTVHRILDALTGGPNPGLFGTGQRQGRG
jgi:raffinose/stachyose/melibiose transport system substrate-binding protein